ncbi:MAG: hypothetical protein F6K17_18580 [Okeania sp. SIO3C4]|nr:hypothetical protein [Okeania sp. SIO3B3]NER04470.1 hypothetical protein [Okeania sp. SIO3C4]
MSNQEDREKFKELIKQAKEANKDDNISDSEARKEIYDNLENKSLRYFLKIFGKDDYDVDDNEMGLLDWLMNDLFKTENKDEYKKRIDNMSK